MSYNPSQATKPITIAEAAVDTALTISAPLSVLVNESFGVTGKLTRLDTGEGIPYMTVALFYDSVPVGAVVTDVNGNYAVYLSIPTTGTYTLKIEFAGTALFTSIFASRNVGVGLEPSKLPVAVAATVSLSIVALCLYMGLR